MAESPAPHPEAAERLREYWTTGEGGARIRWGTPGDFDRCVRALEEHMPGQAEGYCNLLHHRATGEYPAEHAAREKAGQMDRSARIKRALVRGY